MLLTFFGLSAKADDAGDLRQELVGKQDAERFTKRDAFDVVRRRRRRRRRRQESRFLGFDHCLAFEQRHLDVE